MKKVTVTLDEKTAKWARQRSAARNVSLSRFISALLQRKMEQTRSYDRAMKQFFADEGIALKQPEERYPSREKLYDRGHLR